MPVSVPTMAVKAAALALLLFPASLMAEPELMEGLGHAKLDANEAATPAGKLYAERCAVCHDNAAGRIPPRSALRYRPPESVLHALTNGLMKPMVAGLDDAQVKSLVVLLTGRDPKPPQDPMQNACPEAERSQRVVIGADDWTQIHRDIRGSRFREDGAFTAADVEHLQLKWSFAYPGGAGGPVTLAGGRVFLASTSYLVALSEQSGCTVWRNDTQGRVIRALTVADVPAERGGQTVVLFGDDKGVLEALDASTGKPLWTTPVEQGPLGRITASPTVHGAVAYVPISSIEDPLTHDPSYECCTARGGVAAVDIGTGKLLWKKYHIPAQPTLLSRAGVVPRQFGPAGASTYTPLTIDEKRGVLYASTAEQYGFMDTEGPYSVIAYDLASGDVKWRKMFLPSQAERDAICKSRETDCRNFFSMGTSPMLHTLRDGRDVILVGQKSGMVYGLNPDQGGAELWRVRVSEGGDLGGVMYGLGADRDAVYVPVSDVDAPAPARPGALLALDPATGKQLWKQPGPVPACSWTTEGCIAGQVAAVTVIPGAVFAGFWDGHLRVFDTKSGALLRDFDTARDFQAVNGVASGGQVSGFPVVVGRDAIYVTSGASSVLKPGNALLVYAKPTAQ